ncbi:hypothetical protein R69927_04923 [Paraburkholderia domus]|uniref:hypothetical protein n=1 Tax=Paraburkholderia domus TaxID=2793075 RepID=UPI001B2F5F3A|nr:hypothetical protein [Paraburkholderia domus]CAE6892898.1 hypothetical protein R69927_04923 [Paraburkholderia domus]
MSHHTDEVVYLLDRATTLDAAVRTLALALETPNEDPGFALKGIAYKALNDQHGFTVTLHGLTLSPLYEHVLDRSRDCPDLFARIRLCLPGDGVKLGETIISLLIADTGDYSDDGSTNLCYSTFDITGKPSDLSRYRLSVSIAQAVQATLPVLFAVEATPSSASAVCNPTPEEPACVA